MGQREDVVEFGQGVGLGRFLRAAQDFFQNPYKHNCEPEHMEYVARVIVRSAL